MPYAINFGNHQFYGHERWYGDPVGMIDYGPDLCILNFGHAWHVDLSKAEALLASRADTRIKVINAYEPNAPVEDFLGPAPGAVDPRRPRPGPEGAVHRRHPHDAGGQVRRGELPGRPLRGRAA